MINKEIQEELMVADKKTRQDHPRKDWHYLLDR